MKDTIEYEKNVRVKENLIELHRYTTSKCGSKKRKNSKKPSLILSSTQVLDKPKKRHGSKKRNSLYEHSTPKHRPGELSGDEDSQIINIQKLQPPPLKELKPKRHPSTGKADIQTSANKKVKSE